MIVVYIIILILGLSVLVCLHELGHLLVAKACKVYCYEYSIGFGPAIVKHRFRHFTKAERKRRKDETPLFKALVRGLDGTPGETQYSVRWIPLGGYVAMAGEDEEPDTLPQERIPPERTLPGVNHFKQICIMLAGIAMNFLVAYVLFFIAYGAFPQNFYDYTTNKVSVSEKDDNPLYEAGLRTGDSILTLYQVYENLEDEEGNLLSPITFPAVEDQKELTSYLSYKEGVDNPTSVEDIATDCINYAGMNITTNDVDLDKDGKKDVYVRTAASTRTLHLTAESAEGEKKDITLVLKTKEEKDGYVFESFEMDAYYETRMLTPRQAFDVTNSQFSGMFVGIYTALGELFTPEGWQNVGGIVSMYRISTKAVQSGSGTEFLSLWAYISLNLGCFNLIPLPPLDGWNVLIALGETVTRKKFSSKAKNIASTIGMVVLIALAVLLIVKDILVPSPL